MIDASLYKELIIPVKTTRKARGITPYKAKKWLTPLLGEKLRTDPGVNKKGKTYISTRIMKIIHDV